jgi:hypothetical protein
MMRIIASLSVDSSSNPNFCLEFPFKGLGSSDSIDKRGPRPKSQYRANTIGDKRRRNHAEKALMNLFSNQRLEENQAEADPW